MSRKPANSTIRWAEMDTPMGRTYLAASRHGLCRVTWQTRGVADFESELRQMFPGSDVTRDPTGLSRYEREIREYFAGRRRQFSGPVDLTTLSDFQARVLRAASQVPFGETVSYSELGRRVNKPRAARAVGNALRRNPVALVVPCHRVIRADGSTGGYAGRPGSSEKRRLLDLEAGVAAG